jgi:P27 family predicted phage terminase small subunit
MAGRKPTPSHLKILRGNPSKRPLNKTEPKPPVRKLRCPGHLTVIGKKAFREMERTLRDMRLLTVADAMSLELLCAAYAEFREYDEAVKTQGSTYTTVTQTGERMHRAFPEVAMRSDAWRRVKAMLTEFGLTPSSRSKVHVTPEDEDPMDAFLNRRQG